MEKLTARVLAVDDDELMLKFYRDYFAARGASLRTALSPEQALAVMDEWGAQIVVLDLKLPGMDGRELLSRIRLRHPAVKVVFVTAAGEEDVVQGLLELGAHTVLRKPCAIRAVFEAVEKAAMAV